jgi:hypothetical protein
VNEEQIRERLGLEPWDEYARRPRSYSSGRGTGTTTRLICKALARAGDGARVTIVMPWKRARLIEPMALDLAQRAGIDRSLLRFERDDKSDACRGIDKSCLFEVS